MAWGANAGADALTRSVALLGAPGREGGGPPASLSPRPHRQVGSSGVKCRAVAARP